MEQPSVVKCDFCEMSFPVPANGPKTAPDGRPLNADEAYSVRRMQADMARTQHFLSAHQDRMARAPMHVALNDKDSVQSAQLPPQQPTQPPQAQPMVQQVAPNLPPSQSAVASAYVPAPPAPPPFIGHSASDRNVAPTFVGVTPQGGGHPGGPTEVFIAETGQGGGHPQPANVAPAYGQQYGREQIFRGVDGVAHDDPSRAQTAGVVHQGQPPPVIHQPMHIHRAVNGEVLPGGGYAPGRPISQFVSQNSNGGDPNVPIPQRSYAPTHVDPSTGRPYEMQQAVAPGNGGQQYFAALPAPAPAPRPVLEPRLESAATLLRQALALIEMGAPAVQAATLVEPVLTLLKQ